MGEQPKVSKRKKTIKRLRDKKTAIIVAVFLIALTMTSALLIYIKFQSDSGPTPVGSPALQIGETKMSREKYSNLMKEAKDRNIDEKVAEITLQESLRAKEVARMLKVSVPDYLVAAQGQNIKDNIYTPYASLAEYEKVAQYPKALNVLIALIEVGGSLNTILHAPYDSAINGEENRKYAEDMVNDVKLFKEKAVDKNGKPISNPVPLILLDFTVDERNRYTPDVNKSQIAALTDDGRQIISTSEYTTENNGVELKSFTSSIFAVVKPLKKDELSAVKKLPDQDAYLVVNKNEVYVKDPDIRSKLNLMLQGLPR